MSVMKLYKNWRRLGDVGLTLMANPVALIGPAFIASAVTINIAGTPYKAAMGDGWFLLAWAVLSLIGMVLVAWATSPFWGAYYLHRIGKDFGPKTRARVWELFGVETGTGEDNISIERLAWQCGESRKESAT